MKPHLRNGTLARRFPFGLLAHQLCPSGQQRSKELAVYALDRDFTRPAGPIDLCQSVSVVLVGLQARGSCRKSFCNRLS
jgi:hypothetical protein